MYSMTFYLGYFFCCKKKAWKYNCCKLHSKTKLTKTSHISEANFTMMQTFPMYISNFWKLHYSNLWCSNNILWAIVGYLTMHIILKTISLKWKHLPKIIHRYLIWHQLSSLFIEHFKKKVSFRLQFLKK